MESDIIEERLIEVDNLRACHKTCGPADEVVAGAHGDSRELARGRGTLLDFELGCAIKCDALAKLDLHRLGNRNPLGVKDHIIRGHLVEGVGIAEALGVIVPAAEGRLAVDTSRRLGSEFVRCPADVSTEQDVLDDLQLIRTGHILDTILRAIIVKSVRISTAPTIPSRCIDLCVAINTFGAEIASFRSLRVLLAFNILAALVLQPVLNRAVARIAPRSGICDRVPSIREHICSNFESLGNESGARIISSPSVEAATPRVRVRYLVSTRPIGRNVLSQNNVLDPVVASRPFLAIDIDLTGRFIEIENNGVELQRIVAAHHGLAVRRDDRGGRFARIEIIVAH